MSPGVELNRIASLLTEQQILHCPAGPEYQLPRWANQYPLASTRVASFPGAARFHRENAEAVDRDSLAADSSVSDRGEDGLNRTKRLSASKIASHGNALDQFVFIHSWDRALPVRIRSWATTADKQKA